MSKIKIGITIGDMNGISPEVIIKALAHPKMTDFFIPIIYGSSKILSYHKNIVNDPNFNFISIGHPDNVSYNKVNVFNVVEGDVNISLGQPSEESGRIAMAALKQATEHAIEGHLDAIVTAPINKAAMEMAGFGYVGHTEYLTEAFSAPETVMTMVSENLVISLVSNHIPVLKLADSINKKTIIRKLKILSKSLKQDFAFERPTIGVLGLNPHAGDGGVIGDDEESYIKPAIKEAKNNGVLASGPYPSDGFFGSGNFRKVNAIMAMYHDQGLIPFKLLSFGSGVNFTAGLPVIRTSPDHGTAYDIAGKNIANGESMRQALFLAKDLYLNRKQYIEDGKDPIKKEPKPQEEIQE